MLEYVLNDFFIVTTLLLHLIVFYMCLSCTVDLVRTFFLNSKYVMTLLKKMIVCRNECFCQERMILSAGLRKRSCASGGEWMTLK